MSHKRSAKHGFLQSCNAYCHYIAFCSVNSDTWRSMDFGGVSIETGLCTCDLTVALNATQPASCFVNMDNKNNLMFCVILTLLLTVFQRKYYIFHNSLLEFVFNPASFLIFTKHRAASVLYLYLLTGASFASCWGKYQ